MVEKHISLQVRTGFAVTILCSAALCQAQPPAITPGGIVPLYGTVNTIQPGEWVSIYGTNLAGSTATWAGNFPTSLGGTSVKIDGKSAYLSYVSPTQINLQAPDDMATGLVPVMVTTAAGSATSTVTLAPFAPTFLLLDSMHVTGIILRSDGSGAYGGGTYDILGPTGNSLGYPTVAAKPGDSIALYGVGFGPTTPSVPAGQAFSGAAPANLTVGIAVGNVAGIVSVQPTFAGLSGAGLFQINLTVPPGLSAGDLSLQASLGGVGNVARAVISVQPSSTANEPLTITTSGSGAGTVATTPAGTPCGSGCLSFPAGTVVTLMPTPSTGSLFAGWSGACSGTGSCTVTMSSNEAVNAAFSLGANQDLTITTSGSGSGTVTTTPAGTSCGSGCLSFPTGTVVTLMPTPGIGSLFNSWSGACAGMGSCTVTMSSNEAVNAFFSLGVTQYLTITTSGTGSGTVASTPAGNSCGSGCLAFPTGEVVMLMPAPSTGSVFAGWSGACSGTGSCSVTMNVSKAVDAAFIPSVNQNLTITTSGSGSGTVAATPAGTSCGSGCLTFAGGTVVTLTPTPNAGSAFAGWSGACSGTGSCSVTMNSGQAVNATFGPAVNPTLTLTTAGGGSGTVSASPPGTSCGPGCFSYPAGTAVTLMATPAAGSNFRGWSVGCAEQSSSSPPSGTGAMPCPVTVYYSETVSAAFNRNGFVSGTAANGSPIPGANVTLTDSAGKTSATTTAAADGTYQLSTNNMTPPFLVQVTTANDNLYSVSADSFTTTTINTDPFTDLIIRSWYSAQGQNIDSAFSNPVSMPAPGPLNVQLIANAITTLTQLWLTNAGLDTAQFNLISSPFAANGAGLDQVLAESTVNTSTGAVTIAAGGITQTSTVAYNTSASTMTISSTTADSGAATTNSNTIVIPTQSAQQTALASIAATLTGFFNAANTYGRQLTAAELTPFMAADLVNDGLNQTQLAASLATTWRGVTTASWQIHTVRSLDPVGGTADVIVFTPNPVEFWFENVAGAWLIGGDNRIASINIHTQTSTFTGAQSGSAAQLSILMMAPQGTVNGVKVTTAPAVTSLNSAIVKPEGSNVQTFQPTPTTQLMVDLDAFGLNADLPVGDLIPPGAPFAFTLTPASGPAVTYTVPGNVFTTDMVSITSPTSGALSNYTLGQPLAVQWTLPTTYLIATAGINAIVYTGPPGSPSTQACSAAGTGFDAGIGSAPPNLAGATSGTVTLPTTCNGLPVQQVGLNVLARGVNGETAYGSLSIQ